MCSICCKDQCGRLLRHKVHIESGLSDKASAHVVCTPLHWPVQFAIHRGVRLAGHMLFPKIALSPLGIVAPHNTLFLGPSSLIIANSNSIGSAVFVWVSNVMLYNALSMGKKTPKLPNSLRFRYFAEGGSSRGHRQHPQKFGSKDRGCGSGDVLADRQTHRHTHTHYIRIEQTKSSQTCCSR